MKGKFITFEGPDGAGKTTQVRKISDYLKKSGFKVLVTREPGGTELGEKLRKFYFLQKVTVLSRKQRH